MSLQGNSTFPLDPHTEPHHYVTTGQLTLFTIWIGSGFIWLLRFLRSSSSNVNHTDKTRLNGGHTNASNSTSNVSVETKVDVENGGGKSEGNNKNGDKTVRNFSTVKPPPTIDELLQSVLGFGMIMIFFYLCDYRKVCGPRQANLVLIAYASSEGSGEPAHPRSLARTFAARSYKQ